MKVIQGYSSNVNKLMSLKYLKLVGLKFHNFYVFIQQLLPMTICDILPKSVRVTIIKFCLFFNAICIKVIDPGNLDELEHETPIILCQLEISFTPSFFDIVVHLIVHLVMEIRFCGIVYLRCMYLVE